MTLYETLSVAKDATSDEIKKAYRRCAQATHPDKHGGDDAAFKAVKAAYEVLSDPERRRRYDETGDTGSVPSVAQEAQARLLELFQEVISKEQFAGDIVEMMARSVNGIIEHNASQQRIAQRRIRILVHNRDRIKAKTGDNPYFMLVERQITGLQDVLKEIERDTMIAEELLRLIDNYEDEVPLPFHDEDPRANRWTSVPHLSHDWRG